MHSAISLRHGQASEPFASRESAIDATERALQASMSTIGQQVVDRKASTELDSMLQLVDAAVAAQAAQARASTAPAAPQGKIVVNATERQDAFSGRRCVCFLVYVGQM
jgi:hypothetical protein